jgi:hypothetical protein
MKRYVIKVGWLGRLETIISMRKYIPDAYMPFHGLPWAIKVITNETVITLSDVVARQLREDGVELLCIDTSLLREAKEQQFECDIELI